jgi:hypothetical protein
VTKRKTTPKAESLDKPPVQGAALALAGGPLRASAEGTLPEPVPGRVPRRRPGRGNEVSPAEARAIQIAYLTGPTISLEALAERFGRNRGTVSKVLHDPSFDALKAEFDQATAIEARAVLSSGRTAAAQAWLASLDRAASRGEHRPARDLLYVERVCDPPSQQGSGPAVQVFIGQVVTGGQKDREPLPVIEWYPEREDGK